MAKSQGFVLPFTGRVGRTTTGYRAGRYITRVIPDVKPTGEPSESQVQQRIKFGFLANLMSALTEPLKMGLNHLDPTYAYQQGIKLNFPQVSLSGKNVPSITYSEVVVSKGKIINASFAAPSFEETNTISVAFVGNAAEVGAKETDQVYIMAYSPELNAALVSAPQPRTATNATIITPLGWNGSVVHVWGYVVRSARVVSNSVYVGTGTIN